MNRPIFKNNYTLLTLLLLGVCGVFILNISIGSVRINPGKVLEIIITGPSGQGAEHSIIWMIRLPRVLATICGGAALALAGLLLQIYFRNPIVDSFILGVSSGASLVVGLVVMAGLTFGLSISASLITVGAAFSGAMLVMVLVLAIAGRVKNMVTLLVVGLMVGYLATAVTSVLMVLAQKEQLQGFVIWNMGSFSGITWEQVKLLYLIITPALGGALLIAKPLNALLLGESYASSLGVAIGKLRITIIVITSILSGAVTAFAGPVAFIGLAMPHLTRLILGTSDNRLLVPASVLTGALVTSLCDLIARLVLAPAELPISAVTSFFGAPLVVFFLLKGGQTQ